MNVRLKLPSGTLYCLLTTVNSVNYISDSDTLHPDHLYIAGCPCDHQSTNQSLVSPHISHVRCHGTGKILYYKLCYEIFCLLRAFHMIIYCIDPKKCPCSIKCPLLCVAPASAMGHRRAMIRLFVRLSTIYSGCLVSATPTVFAQSF